MKKKIVLFLEKDKDYAFLIQGLHAVADVEYISYKDTDDLLENIKNIFAAYKAESQ
ncbi:hypothetical protein BACIT_1194 [Bacillus amyloliquefaciens]|nr:hypothetical protein BACIT_1194 [Bacillus amyloliquefaciens]